MPTRASRPHSVDAYRDDVVASLSLPRTEEDASDVCGAGVLLRSAPRSVARYAGIEGEAVADLLQAA